MKHIFIVNPYAGSMTFANNLRQQLEKMNGFEYFLFNSRYTGNETELTRKIIDFFPQEQLRIYACGGSGTLRNVLEGVGENPNVELAFYPCGMTNDFLKCFKPEDRTRFYDIAELIGGETLVLYRQTASGAHGWHPDSVFAVHVSGIVPAQEDGAAYPDGRKRHVWLL